MTSNTDVRKWAVEHGIELSRRGPIPADVRERYDAETGGPPDPVVFGSAAGYDGGVTEADFPPADDRASVDDMPQLATVPDVDDHQGDAPAVDDHQGDVPARKEEIRPRKVKAPSPLARWRDRGKAKPAKPAAKRRHPRVSLAGLIEDAWGQLAWAAAPLPPMQKLLHAQAPMAGIALEDALRGTMVDRALQPLARTEDKAKAVGGLMMPPMALMAVLATAPQPQEVQTPEGGTALAWPEPSMQHKGALLTLRWSLMLMAETGAAHLEEYQRKAEAAAARGEQADRFMAWLLGWEMPAAPEGVAEEEEAIARAQAMFGGTGDTG